MGRFARVIMLVVSSIAVAFAFAAPAGAGLTPVDVTPLTVVKTVSGPVPEGTTFTATIACDDDIIIDGQSLTDTATVTFASDGQPTSPDEIQFDDPGTCTVTETVTGGAATTTYACESDTVGAGAAQVLELCGSAGPQATPITVTPETVLDASITVTIHNTFVEPAPIEPAPAVAAAPAFTG